MPNEKARTTTKADGSFELECSSEQKTDRVLLEFTHINYHSLLVRASTEKELNIMLQQKVYTIEDVAIHSAYNSNNTGNKFTYSPQQAASSISIIGEPDVVRHISSLPGVSQGIEGSLGLFVRGSNNGSNRIEFNDVPFYSYSHLLGLFSSFSPDAIETTTFRPGGIPIQSGNLSSSLLHITPKEALHTPLSAKLSLSPYMLSSYVGLPLKKDKIAVQLAVRTSPMPWVINQAMSLQESGEEEEPQEIKGEVLDFTALLNWKINPVHSLDFMYYRSNDYFGFKDSYNHDKINWSSTALKAGWDFQPTTQLKLKTTAYYSATHSVQEQVYFKEYTPEEVQSQLRLGSKIEEWSLNSLLKYRVNELVELSAGLNYQLQRFTPASEKTIYSQNIRNKASDTQNSNLLAAFADAKYTMPERLELTLGYRHTWHRTAEENYRQNFDLRFLGNFYWTKQLGIELSYDRLTQYYHVLEGLPTGWSLNVLAPSDEIFPEEITQQIYGGIFLKPSWQKAKLHFTLGGYYRHMQNLVSYTNTINMFGLKDSSWEDEIDSGQGESYGLELSGTIQTKCLGSTLAYTLSKANRQFSKINRGQPYPFKFDRRHILNWQSKYTISSRTNRKGHRCEQLVNAVVSYSSGHRATLPVGSYQGVLPQFWDVREDSWFSQHSWKTMPIIDKK